MSSQLINQVLELTNIERANAGLQPLTLNSQLAQAAQGHSDSMAADDFFAHTGADGSNVGDRVSDTGYNYATTGENIAAGQNTAAEVVEGWMNSPGHRANILNADYTEIGIGYELLENDTGSVNYNHYWTQVFGSQQGGGTTPATNNSQSTETVEQNNEPIAIEDNTQNTPDLENSTPIDLLQPEAASNDSELPQMNEVEVIETEPDSQIKTLDNSTTDLLQPEAESNNSELPQMNEVEVIETELNSQIETLDNSTTDLESPQENDNSLSENSDLSLFGADIGNLTADDMDYGDGLTGSSDNLAMTGGDDAMISPSQEVYSFSSSTSISMGGDSESAYTDSNYDFAGVAEMLKGSWLGTSEADFNQYESDLIENISNSGLDSSQQQKAIEIVKSFF